jgi:hypothetical protein
VSTITSPIEVAAEAAGHTHQDGRLDALRALTGRRSSLSLRNPRAILLPLATPLLIALVIAPWFFAGSLFSIHALPSWLTFVAKLLPVTHAVALMRYGAGLHAADLHAIWGLTNSTVMAALSLGVLVLYAAGFMYLAARVFIGKTVR